MNQTVLKPTAAICAVADHLENAVGRFLKAQSTMREVGTYESNVEALILYYSVLRSVEAICTLARRDLVMLSPALCIARAGFETTVRVIWMLKPTNAFEREARWLSHLEGEESFCFRAAKMLQEFGLPNAGWNEQGQAIQEFRKGVEQQLPSGVKRQRIPKFREMLKDIGNEQYYLNYMRLSQYSHGSHAAGDLYRKNLGCGKQIGEFVSPELWVEPLQIAWYCLVSGTSLLTKVNGDAMEFLTPAQFNEVNHSHPTEKRKWLD